MLFLPCPVQVQHLIETGQANPSLRDRWGHTGLDEARRVGALPVVEYLNNSVTGEWIVVMGCACIVCACTRFSNTS